MAYGEIAAIAEGIGAQADVTCDHQITTAIFSLFLVGALLPLQQAWMKELNQDSLDYYNDTIASKVHPELAGKAAQANQKKELDSNESDLETGNLNNLL